MKKLIVYAFAGMLLFSCSNSSTKTEAEATKDTTNIIESSNDLENAAAIIPSWMNEKTVVRMNEPAAHSGNYASITNDTIEFGYGYLEQIKNIHAGLPKNVDVSGWIFTTVASPDIAIILDISEKDKQYDWKAFPLSDKLMETGKWIEFSGSFSFDKPLNPEQAIKIYPWNQSKKTVYIDDLKITFEY